MADERGLVPVDELITALKNDSGSKDRATVALVDAKMDGLKELVRAEFSNVREDLRALGSVTADVIRLELRVDDHERRVETIENRSDDDRNWRRDRLPSLLISGVAVVVSVLGAVSHFF